MRETWKEINNILGKHNKHSAQSKFKDDSGNIISNSQEIANKFNEFFVNVGPKLASEIHNEGKKYFHYLHNAVPSCMYMKPIVELDVLKVIGKLKPNKSAGYDKIGNVLIKKVCNEI